jgi:hypothetical protein
MAVLIVLSACGAPPVEQSPQDLVSTIAAATIAALPSPSLAPSDTELPTDTPIPSTTPAPTWTETLVPVIVPDLPSLTPSPVIETLTPTITLTPSPLPDSGSESGKVQGIGAYQCMVIGQKPEDWSDFKPGQLIYVVWRVKNVGERDWPKGGLEIFFIEGAKIYEFGQVQKSQVGVKVGGTGDFLVVMRAPERGGSYLTKWGLRRDKFFCKLIFGLIVR